MLHALAGVSGDTALDIIETYQSSQAMQKEAVETFERLRRYEQALIECKEAASATGTEYNIPAIVDAALNT